MEMQSDGQSLTKIVLLAIIIVVHIVITVIITLLDVVAFGIIF
jgi:hypothetical protein